MEPTSGSLDTAGDELVIDLTTQRVAPAEIDLWAPEWREPEYLASAIADLRFQFGSPTQRYGVYFLEGRDRRSGLGRAVEVERFADAFDNDSSTLRDLYADFEDNGATEFICVVDHEEGVPAGVIRTVRNTADRSCRTLIDLQADGENGWGLTWDEIVERSSFAAQRPEDITDIPTAAVAKAYQGAARADGVSKALYAALLQRALGSDANTWVCMLDRIPYILIQAVGRDVMNEFTGVAGKPYYGAEDTVPLWANFREYESYIRRDHPDAHALLVRSEGLLDQYFFGFPDGPPTWEPLDPEVIDLRMYEPVPESR